MLVLTVQADQRKAVEVLLECGVEEGLIGNLHAIHSPSVTAMADLRGWGSEWPEKPKGKGDIAVTEEEIRAAFEAVFTAEALQEEELRRRYGPRYEVVTRTCFDVLDQRVDTFVEWGCDGTSRKGKYPVTAARTILLQLVKGDERFSGFVRSCLTQTVEGSPGLRVVDVIKKRAAEEAVAIIRSAAGAA